MQLVAMVVTVGVVRSCEVDGVLCVHPMRGNPCIVESEGVANSVQQRMTRPSDTVTERAVLC